MAGSDEIFLALDEPLDVAAARVAGVLRLEFNGDLRTETGELQYKGPARTFDGVIGVYIGLNGFQPEPDEVQAMDGYSVVVDVQSRQRMDAQAEETRLAFQSLVDALADVPALCPTMSRCSSRPIYQAAASTPSTPAPPSTTQTSTPGGPGLSASECQGTSGRNSAGLTGSAHDDLAPGGTADPPPPL